VIADARVHRWPLGNVYAHPGRARLQPALEGALGPHRNLHLAGDYFAELGNLEAAARTGATAAERVRAHLPRSTRTRPAMPDQLQLHGVLPALITPFTEDGAAIDRDALAANVERLVGAGVGGLVPGGSTGEFTTLSHAERRDLVELTIAAADGRVPVVAGTGALSTAETVELSVHAERAGAAAVMVVPPFYDALSWRELLAHYTAVADRISIPIMYYNLPSASGVTLTLEQFRELREAANVTSLKDTGGDATAATELIQAGADGPTLLNGWDTLTFAALAAGVRAVVWGTASILPEPCVELHRLLIDDVDLPAARELWARIWPLCRFLEGHSYPAAVKAACAMVGDVTGPTRAPLLALGEDATAELAGLLERAGASRVG
jgi:4-hydroxy-tetrahydrodipicolinate synthase